MEVLWFNRSISGSPTRETYDAPMEDRPAPSRALTGDAYALHESVPPDRWCVTRNNLEYLRKEVGKGKGERWRLKMTRKTQEISRDSNGSFWKVCCLLLPAVSCLLMIVDVDVGDRYRPGLSGLSPQVKDALLMEEINPNDRDPFQRSDRIYGPSIYTVLGWH